MALSTLIISILKQAEEPLLCLNGVGYFSEEDWIQLDFIVNKKYVWTTGPKSRFYDAMRAGSNANKITNNEAGDSAPSMSEQGGVKISPSPVKRARTLNFTPNIGKNQPSSPSAAPRGVEAWVSAARNGLPEITRPQLPPIPCGTLVELDNNPIEDSVLVPKIIAVNGQRKDVNAFETNNSAEWDEEPVSRRKNWNRNDMNDVFEEKFEKIEDVSSRESQIVRTATITRSTRRRTKNS